MKKGAVILFIFGLFILEGSTIIVSGQDTLFKYAIPSPESMESLNEGLQIMQEALKEQMKTLHMNTDSLHKQMEKFREHMKDFHLEPIIIPEDFHFDFDFDFDNSFGNMFFSSWVELKGESKTEDVLIDVDKELSSLMVVIKGKVRSGRVNVDIYDPADKKQGSFSIENDRNENGEAANGSIHKKLSAPMTGKWKVKVNSEKAFGNVQITSIKY